MHQTEVVLRHLRRHRTITSAQAWSKYAISRLASVIYDLRRAGECIATEEVRNGRMCYARYRLMR